MNAIVISDLHLGSRFCYYDRLMTFLRALPSGYDLVLNGDTVDRWRRHLLGKHSSILDLLAEESTRRRVVWVRGNHDERYSPARIGSMEFVPSHSLGERLFISHGYDFDGVMPGAKAFIICFRYLHYLRIGLGAEPVHVAFYAKRFKRLYEVLRTNIRTNAVRYARERGFKAVTCGHTHYVEDLTVDGIRYINTGAWTEAPIFYLKVTGDDIQLIEVAG